MTPVESHQEDTKTRFLSLSLQGVAAGYRQKSELLFVPLNLPFSAGIVHLFAGVLRYFVFVFVPSLFLVILQ